MTNKLKNSTGINQVLSAIEISYTKIEKRINSKLIEQMLKQFPNFEQDFKIIKQEIKKFHNLLLNMNQLEFDPINTEDPFKSYRHDLRASISSVLGYSELIKEDNELLDNFENQIFEEINQLCQQVLPLIDKLKNNQVIHEIRSCRIEDKISINKGNILIIDDSKEKSNILGRRLSKVGHVVLYAGDGLKGLKALPNNDVDVILLDMIMPGLSGYEILLKIKENIKWREIPILVISTMNDMRNIIECIQAGADDYLPIPVNNTLLHARINSCLEKKFTHDREQEMIQEIKNARKRLAAAIDSIDEGFAIFDVQDNLISCNARFKTLYPSVEKLGNSTFSYKTFLEKNFDLGIYHSDKRQDHGCRLKNKTDNSNKQTLELYMGYHLNPTKSYNLLLSSGKWIEVIENKIPEGGIVAVHKDISEGKRKEDKLEYLARHDPLTGLANRARLNQFLKEIPYDITDNDMLGIAFLDLDGFKKVNDELGHDFGDYLLMGVAFKLKSISRTQDLVARIGGDEFVIVLNHLKSFDQASIYAQRCLKKIGTSVRKNGIKAEFGVSIGLALMPSHADNSKDLLLRADEAMYLAKKSGKNKYCFAS